jgi:hypothetical protein
MNRKQLTLLLIVGIVIGGAALYMTRRGAESYQTTTPLLGQRVLPDFPMNDVGHIHIRNVTNEVTLVRQDGRWQVRERFGYPADFSTVSGLLQKFWDMKIVQVEEVGPSQLHRLQLAEPGEAAGSGTLVAFSEPSGEPVASVLLGRQHQRQGGAPSPMGGDNWPDGRYLRVLNGAGRVVLVSDALSEVEPRPDRYLNKDFLRVEKVSSLAVVPPDGPAWGLIRETEGGAWSLADADAEESLDTAKATFANNVLSYPNFTDVIDPARSAEEIGMEQPWLVELKTFEGFHYTVRIGRPNEAEQYPVSVRVQADYPRQRLAAEDESEEDRDRLDREFQEKLARLDEKLEKEKRYSDWTYLVTKWTVDSLMKSRADLLSSAEGEAATTDFQDDPGPLDDALDFDALDLENLGIAPNR